MILLALALAAAAPHHHHAHHHEARDGWNGRRYVPFCEGSKAMPRRNDPWIRHYVRQGNNRRDARIELSDNRTNACD